MSMFFMDVSLIYHNFKRGIERNDNNFLQKQSLLVLWTNK
jgi:hypothetical protein